MTHLRAAFFGTPAEAVPVLAGTLQVADVELVVTRQDAPRGRSGKPVPPPVKIAAGEQGLRVVQPRRPAEVIDEILGLDIAVLAAYGAIIPGDLLTAPELGFINLHYSLLPRWRGASPVVRTVLAGDEVAGVTIIQMDEGLDTGPLLASAETPVGAGETTGELTARLAVMGGDLVAATLPAIAAGAVEPVPQDDARATAAAKVTVEEAFLDPGRHSAEAVDRAVRAFNPKPGAWGVVEGDRIKVWKVAYTEEASEPGRAEVLDGAVVLGCSDGAVELIEIQPPGRPPMEARSWMNGRRNEPARFESG